MNVNTLDPLDFYKHVRCDEEYINSIKEDIIKLVEELDVLIKNKKDIKLKIVKNKESIIKMNSILNEAMQINDQNYIKDVDEELNILKLERSIFEQSLDNVRRDIYSLKESLVEKRSHLDECELKRRLRELESVLDEK